MKCRCLAFLHQVLSRNCNGVPASCIARSLVLTGHLLYASPLASHSRVLCVRLRDMRGMNMVLWLATCLARPGLRYATDSSNLKLNTFSCTCYCYFYTFNFTSSSVALSEKVHTAFYCPAPVSEMQRASKVTVSQQDGSSYSCLMKADFQSRV